MKVSIRQKLEKSAERYEEVGHMLADPQVLARPEQFRELSVEYARLQPTATALQEYRRLEAELSSTEPLRQDGDARMRALGEEEALRLRTRLAARGESLHGLVLPQP